MLSKLKSFGLVGINGNVVDIEVDVNRGTVGCDLVGLGDTAVKESKERVKSAIKNSGFEYPVKHLTINLAPADMKKEGPVYDLGIAIGILAASAQLENRAYKDYLFIGELSLDGTIKKVRGVLPMLISARELGFRKFIIPKGNSEEASYINNIEAFGFSTLTDLVAFLKGETTPACHYIKPNTFEKEGKVSTNRLDFKFVKGQKLAKRALEIAAAGGHNVIMIGPPGSGKSMLAKCFSGILPDLTFNEALEVTKIHSVAGELDSKKGIITERPFRTPHHTASTVSITGGGVHSKPGEISLAHNGVLFLDEFPEYSRQLIETLRQPLEDGSITVARASQTVTYPASFTLVASMNPCPCGYYGSDKMACTCTSAQIHKYMSKLSGPIMDRIDIHVEVDNIKYDELQSDNLEESTDEIKKRVDKARAIQLERFKGTETVSNSRMTVPQTKQFCKLSKECLKLMENAFDLLKLSARAHDKILKVARTIADLDGKTDIQPEHIAEAISYRNLDRKFWRV